MLYSVGNHILRLHVCTVDEVLSEHDQYICLLIRIKVVLSSDV